MGESMLAKFHFRLECPADYIRLAGKEHVQTNPTSRVHCSFIFHPHAGANQQSVKLLNPNDAKNE
jgi:hypothetical protein